MTKRRRELSDAEWGIGDAKSAPAGDLLPAVQPPAAPPSPVAPKDAVDPAKLSPEARAFVAASMAPETVRSYSYHWNAFARWCRLHGLRDCPVDSHDLANYIAARAKHGVPLEEDPGATGAPWAAVTIAQALASIGAMHEFRGFDSPRGTRAVKHAWKGIRREKGVAPQRRAEALSVKHLRAASIALRKDDTLDSKQDRSLVLLGFAGALRRGELLALEVQDIAWVDEGIRLTLRRHYSGSTVTPGTKTNPAGAVDEVLGIGRGRGSTCPVQALREWMDAAEIKEGRIFRVIRLGVVTERPLGPQGVVRAIKTACERLGLDPALYSGHSLRAGLATAAAKAKKAPWVIQKRTRHKSIAMLERYIRDAGIFDEDAAEGLL